MNPQRRAITARDRGDNWFRLEWVVHDGRRWVLNEGHSIVEHMAARLESRTDCEGSKRDMLVLARAILDGTSAMRGRCAVRPEGDHFAFSSPRNSHGREALVHGEDARAWATSFMKEHS
jgi:hypothetical protein